jgi:hypothetical protein
MSASTIMKVLSYIPWVQVVQNAPQIAEGASKLWSTVTRGREKNLQSAPTAGSVANQLRPEPESLSAHVRELEVTVKNLQDQMQASSELIKALADQNTQLVNRVELHRIRLNRIRIAAGIAGLVLFAAVGYLLMQQ